MKRQVSGEAPLPCGLGVGITRRRTLALPLSLSFSFSKSRIALPISQTCEKGFRTQPGAWTGLAFQEWGLLLLVLESDLTSSG